MTNLDLPKPTSPGRLIHTASGLMVERADYTPHLPMMRVMQRLNGRLTKSTIAVYMRHFVAFEAYLLTAGVSWDAPPASIRKTAHRYLQDHGSHVILRADRWYVYTSSSEEELAVQTLRLRFEALRTIYEEAIRGCIYPHDENPFSNRLAIEANRAAPNRPPSSSGLTSGHERTREPEQYWLFQTGYWAPQHLSHTADFAQTVINAFSKASLRDQCVTRILFEGGPRVDEVCRLTVEGWHYTLLDRPAFHHSFKLRTKGKGDVAIKPVHVDEATGLLLRRYFMEERPKSDPLNQEFTNWCAQEGHLERTPENYYAFLRATQRPLASVAVFLSCAKSPYTAKAYREGAWRPLLKAAGIKARPHQARHDFVTRMMEGIAQAYAFDLDQQELARRALGEYMFWANPAKTLQAYDHSKKDETNLINLTRTIEHVKNIQRQSSASMHPAHGTATNARSDRTKRRNGRIQQRGQP